MGFGLRMDRPGEHLPPRERPYERASLHRRRARHRAEPQRSVRPQEVVGAAHDLDRGREPAHTAIGAMSGALGKKLGLVVTSVKEEGRGRVYRIGQQG